MRLQEHQAINDGNRPARAHSIRHLSMRERRRLRHEQRVLLFANAQRLVHLCDWLPPDDRALVQAHLRDGLTMARLAGLRRVSVLTVQRRMARLVQRMNAPEFILTIAQVQDWAPNRAAIARKCILEGASLREAAKRLGCSVYLVRRELGNVRAMAAVMSLTNRLPDVGAAMKRSA